MTSRILPLLLLASSSLHAGPMFGALNTDNYNNRIVNSTFLGATAGSPGDPGYFWALQDLGTMDVSVSGTGTEDGIKYIDINFSGTGSNESDGLVQNASYCNASATYCQGAYIPVNNGETWTVSAYIKLQSGTWPDGIGIGINLFSSSYAYLGSLGKITHPGGNSLGTQRFSHTDKIANASVAYIAPYFSVYVPAGVTTNITYRIGGVQMEKAGAPTKLDSTTPKEVILTSGTSTWAVPSDWRNNHNWVHLIGAGGSGSARQNASIGGVGGGGGQYVGKTNATLIAGKSISVSIPAGSAGTSTSFNSGAITAGSGGNATTSTVGAGGTGGTGGTISFAGGAGYKPASGGAGGGGGGAAGFYGAGSASTGQAGGAAENNHNSGGAAATAGAPGWSLGMGWTNGSGSGAGGEDAGPSNGVPGGDAGGGGGGAGNGSAASTGGAGGAGLIYIMYVNHSGGR